MLAGFRVWLAACTGIAVLTSPVQASVPCQVVTGDRFAQIAFPRRTITLIGWTHPGGAQLHDLTAGMKTAVTASDCDATAKALDATLVKNAAFIAEAHRVLELLKATDDKNKLDAIGLEHSTTDLPILVASYKSGGRSSEAILRRCGAERLGHVLSEWKLVTYGPGVAYVRASSRTIGVDAYEDAAAKDSSDRAAWDATTINRVYAADLSIAGRSLFAQFPHGPMTDAEIDRIAAQATSEDAKRRIKANLADVRVREAGFAPRNTAIAKRLSNVRGNYVAVIGSLHVEDLVSRLTSECKKENSDQMSMLKTFIHPKFLFSADFDTDP